MVSTNSGFLNIQLLNDRIQGSINFMTDEYIAIMLIHSHIIGT